MSAEEAEADLSQERFCYEGRIKLGSSRHPFSLNGRKLILVQIDLYD